MPGLKLFKNIDYFFRHSGFIFEKFLSEFFFLNHALIKFRLIMTSSITLFSADKYLYTRKY